VVDIDAEEYHGNGSNGTKRRSGKRGKWFAKATCFAACSPRFHTVSNTTKHENLLLNLFCNLVVPTIVLMKFSTDRWLGPMWGMVAALILPIGYGAYDLAKRKKTNFLSVLGTVSVLVSGSLALLKVGGMWFAVKDAILPTLIGISVLASLRTKRPLVRELFYNEQVIDVARIDAALTERGEHQHFERLLRRASVGLALTFIATAPVSFALARYVLTAPAGTPEFNAQLGRMHWLALIVIALPSTAAMMVVFWKLLNGLTALTGLSEDEIFPSGKKKA
jgi:hypothetical protein